MAADLTLSELTASLVQELARSAAEVERGQRDEFVALARDAALPEPEFVDRVVGRTATERKPLIDQFLGRVLPDLASRTPLCLATHLVPLDETAKASLVNAFGDDAVRAIESSQVQGVTSVIPRETLEQLVETKLRKDAAERHRELKASLRARLPKIEMARGTLSVKVLLKETDGKVIARLATPETVRQHTDSVSTVTVDFTVGAFPSFEA